MLIKVGFDIAYQLPAPTSAVLMLYIHPSRTSSVKRPERLRVEPKLPLEKFRDCYGNRCARLFAPAGRLRITCDTVVEDSGLPDVVNENARECPVHELSPEILLFLHNSRYCEVDRLSEIAWDLFGKTQPGWPRVQAICEWVHANLRFDYSLARATRSAHETYIERVGVCRDFQHLAMTFCRCLNIPARYVSGYLGDIGVPPVPYPMDFSAWFETYLDDQWYTFDARHNVPRIGRIVMTRGRDAADVALTTTYGQHTLEHFRVWTDEVSIAKLVTTAATPT